jgi:hypothetical protein
MTTLKNPVPTTELGAVNVLLASIGEAPVSTVSGNQTSDVSLALAKLAEENVAVQLMGWDFNTEEDYPLVPDNTGTIFIPDTALRVDVSRFKRWDVNPVVRGRRLYDKKNRTYTFKGNVEAEITFGLPFEDLPQAARWYITVRAGRKFQFVTVASEALNRFTDKDESDALTTLKQAEASSAQYSIFDNYAVRRGLSPRRPYGTRR